MADPTIFNGCGEVLAYSTITIWLVTWGIRRLKYNVNAHDKQIKGWLAKPENRNYLIASMGGIEQKSNAVPQDVLDFMIKINRTQLGNSFLPSVIAEDDLKYLDPCVKQGFLLKEFYKGIGDLYVITDKGKNLT